MSEINQQLKDFAAYVLDIAHNEHIAGDLNQMRLFKAKADQLAADWIDAASEMQRQEMRRLEDWRRQAKDR
jgi:hypothetical protein